MRVLKITSGEWINASRDKRELTVLKEMGADVSVMAKGKPGDNFLKDNVDGFDVFRFSTRPLGSVRFLNPLNRFLSLFIWAYKAKKFKADIISGHDLFPLFIAWLSNIGRKSKAKLVYDSHEFELMSLKHLNKGKIHLCFIKKLEKFLINRSAFSIMVNDSIADEVQKIHKLKDRPIVVRSTPNNWVLNHDEISSKRELLCNQLNVSKDTFLLMYHGAIDASRGIEKILDSVSRTERTAAIVLGNGNFDYKQSLKEYSASLGIQNRTLFLEAVPLKELYKYVGAVDCGIVLVSGIQSGKKISYYYGLGNKFFENIQSLTPIISSNIPEQSKLIEHYNIGLVVDPDNMEEIITSINLMKDDKELYSKFKNNLKIAKEDLCWENEMTVLEKAYKMIM